MVVVLASKVQVSFLQVPPDMEFAVKRQAQLGRWGYLPGQKIPSYEAVSQILN